MQATLIDGCWAGHLWYWVSKMAFQVFTSLLCLLRNNLSWRFRVAVLSLLPLWQLQIPLLFSALLIFWHRWTPVLLSVTYSFWRLSLHPSSQLPLLQDSSCFFLHTSGFSNTLLYFFLMVLRSANHPWKISAIWREVPVVFIDCTGPFRLECNLGHLHWSNWENCLLPLSSSLFVRVCVSLYVVYA